MSRFMSGLMIVLFVLVVNVMIAFIATGVAEGASFSDCNNTGNTTECENIGKTSFFATLADVSYTGIDGLPDIFNVLYVLVMGLLLTGGILLIVLAFIPTTSA